LGMIGLSEVTPCRPHHRAIAVKEKALGPDHSSTLSMVNNLGLLYRDQGKLEEAEQMFEDIPMTDG